MKFVALLFLVLFDVFGMFSAKVFALASDPNASSAEFVEFLIGDRTKETRKWGHVSLRVNSAGKDEIFDFGRYGKMWGKRNASEGEPILRVWKHGSYPTYKKLHEADGGVTRAFRFQSTNERNRRILEYFNTMKSGAPVMQSNRSFTAYIANYSTFHAVNVNCVTVSIKAFENGFPEFALNDPEFAIARDLEFYMSAAAQMHGQYDSELLAWRKLWWPLDLMALLNEAYVRRGVAQLRQL